MTVRTQRGFTLVEVILAILIISGIMVVLLFFYQRAAETRESAMRETEFLTTVRLVMEQITVELRSARLVEDQFMGLEGSSNSLSFICTGLPATTRWVVDTNETVLLPPATDLKQIHYSLGGGTNIYEALGLLRSEKLLLPTASLHEPEILLPESDLTGTNDLATASTNSLLSTNRPALSGPLLTDKVRFLQFRFWDGTDWVDAWTGLDLPGGVEVSMGREPIPTDVGDSGYPYEVFRRVIYLPNSTHPRNRVVFEPEEEAL